MEGHRVVVSGIGVSTPIGIGREEFWEGLLAGRNGISRITLFDPSEFRSQMAGEVKGFHADDGICAVDERSGGEVGFFGRNANQEAKREALFGHVG